MARPKQNIRRDHQLNFSLTEDEFELVQMRAHAAGQRAVDYGRSLLLYGPAAAPQAMPAPPSRAERLVYLELKRLGNNLNQAVRICNTTRRAPPPSLEPLLAEIRALLNRSLGHGA